MIFVALITKTLPNAGSVSNDGSTKILSESSAAQSSPSVVSTSYGLDLSISDVDSRLRQRCMFGGLLVMEGMMLGLTAGYPFSRLISRHLANLTHNDFEIWSSSSFACILERIRSVKEQIKGINVYIFMMKLNNADHLRSRHKGDRLIHWRTEPYAISYSWLTVVVHRFTQALRCGAIVHSSCFWLTWLSTYIVCKLFSSVNLLYVK